MKLLLIAGAPSVGKTTIVKQVIKNLRDQLDNKISYVKIDVCSATEDIELKEEFGISTRKVYSGDLCPDHAEAMIMKDAIDWAYGKSSKLLIVESAGLCLRCSPYLNQGLGIVIVSASSGIKVPEKMKPIISLADVAVITRIDMISQAEREIITQKLNDDFPNLTTYETNALQGTALNRLYTNILDSKDIEVSTLELKGNPPLGTCTICIGKKDIGWDNHFGVVRSLEGSITECFYRGD